MSVPPSASSNSRAQVWLHCLLWGGLAGLMWLLCFRFPVFWVTSGIGEPNRPFLDLYGSLAALDSVRAGLDPYAPSTFDPYHRPHIYSDWWLALASLGWGRKDTVWLGATLAGGLLLATLAWLRPRSWRDGMVAMLLLLSPAFLLAVQRINNDLVILLMVSGGLLCFRRAGWAWQVIGIVIFAASAVLKYYPLVTLVLLLELRGWRRMLIGLGLYAAVLLAALPGLLPGLKSAARNMPGPEWLYAFGAPVLWRDLGSSSQLGWVLLGVGVLAWAAWQAAKRVQLAGEPAPIDQAGRDFLCGALMIVGVFFLGASYAYKLVFAIWLVPWLRRPPLEPGERPWLRITWFLLVAVLWLEGTMAILLNALAPPDSPVALGILKGVLVTTQLLEWALVACLARFVFLYLGQRGRELLSGRSVPV